MVGVHALHRTSCDIVENKKRWKSNVVLILLNPDFLFYFFVKPFSFPLSFAAFFTSSAPYTSASMTLMRSANAAPPQALAALEAAARSSACRRHGRGVVRKGVLVKVCS